MTTNEMADKDNLPDKVNLFPLSARPLPPEMMGRGFDDRDTPGGASLGIGGLEMTFWLRGEKGAVTWRLFTGCFLPRTQTEWLDGFGDSAYKPDAGAVEWHCPAPLGSGEPHFDCRLLGPGNPCYGDIGYMIGDKAYEALVSGGEMALWRFLGEMYRDQFVPGSGEGENYDV